jgi:phenylalanyl-tRNA synthetase alpha chain
MSIDLASLEKNALAALEQTRTLADVEAFHARYLGRKDGELTSVLRSLATLSPEEKKRIGQEANRVRDALDAAYTNKKNNFASAALLSHLETQRVDLSLPGHPFARGHEHPILSTIRDITHVFERLGFDVAEGPEVETDQFNFTDLNIPADHPARDMHDTFYVADGSLLLRTHTSPVQIRVMKNAKPPLRLISPGRVFRHEATDATHAAVFHQVEGLVIDKNVSFADLKGTLTHFAEKFFGKKIKVRFMPSYFPFVEPGAQMDVQCFVCGGSGSLKTGAPCGLCKATGWIEMLGAGLVHPQVLRNVGLDPEQWSGFAFGMGVERIVMTRSRVNDIRHFIDGDLRFIEQFS